MQTSFRLFIVYKGEFDLRIAGRKTFEMIRGEVVTGIFGYQIDKHSFRVHLIISTAGQGQWITSDSQNCTAGPVKSD